MSKLTVNNIVKRIIEEMYDTSNKKELEDDHGIMFKRVTKSDGRYEVGTSFYYRTNNSTARLVDEIRVYAEANGFSVDCDGSIDFNTKPWPKTSWATSVINVSIKLS